MSDDLSSAPTNPNQGFDNYAKEFALRIQLLQAAGEYQKAVAEANLTNAKALSELERVKTSALINKTLRLNLNRLEDEQREYEKRLKLLERHLHDLYLFLSGQPTTDLTLFYRRLDSIQWFLGQGAGTYSADGPLFTVVPANCLTTDNYLNISQTHLSVYPELDKRYTLQSLCQFMRFNLTYFIQGSALHQWLATEAQTFAQSKDATIAKLQSALDTARKGQYDELHELLPFLSKG